ncbi:MAG: AAA family ATPase [Candidatus Atribacteria bacterium]|nr:AAA family ATPase [Candidatus Atribacteria bacterium]
MKEKHNSAENNDDVSSTKSYFKISNPYHAYDLESGRWFYHEELIKNIKIIFEKRTANKLLVIQGNPGSGKSSTLRRLKEDKAILGDNYIPIYVDSDEIKSNDVNRYLFHVLKTINAGLRIYKLQSHELSSWFEQSITLTELMRFTKSIERTLNGNKLVVLMFDEFDQLQQTVENPEIIHAMVQYYDFILNKTDKIRLILAGKRKIVELARKTNTQDFFKSGKFIYLDEIFETQDIQKLIINPVKDHITYSPESINYILETTGRNLYCQQLLCYYIFNYLNEQKRGNCELIDVGIAIERMLSERRVDFIHYWKNIYWKFQLIVSALADEKITKKKGQKYFFEETALLEEIFDEELFSLLKRLYENQQISKFEGVRFDQNPFKVQVFGEWVKRNHPFLDTIMENWDKVSDIVTLTSLYKIIELIPVDKIPLEREILESVIKFSMIWTKLKQKIKGIKADFSLEEELIKALCELLGFEIKTRSSSRKPYFKIDMRRLNLGGLEEVIFFNPVNDDLNELEANYIQDEILRQDKPGMPSFLLCLKMSEKINELIQKRFLGLVIIEEDDLKKTVLSSHPLQVFTKEIILKQVKPSAVSNYTTEGPVKTTFFGRQDELGKIIKAKNKNFAIIGSRKIGKTSLLMKIKDELPSNLVPIYLDLEAPQNQNNDTFQRLLSEEMSHLFYWVDEIYCDFSNIRSVIKKLYQQNMKTPLFLFDEIDTLLKYDRDNEYKLMRTFRSLFQEGLVQVILSGYSELYYEMHIIESPLYNFCHPLQLGKLKENEALDLITIPMERISVKYNNLEDRKLMLEYTSKHPNLLQYFCVHLIERIENHDEESLQRTIFREDIESVFESPNYESYIIDDFYLFFREEMPSFERLIILLIVDKFSKVNKFIISELIKVLKNYNLNISTGKLLKYLDNLILRYLLEKEIGGKYAFALPIFPEILRRRYDLENLIEEALEDARQSL